MLCLKLISSSHIGVNLKLVNFCCPWHSWHLRIFPFLFLLLRLPFLSCCASDTGLARKDMSGRRYPTGDEWKLSNQTLKKKQKSRISSPRFFLYSDYDFFFFPLLVEIFPRKQTRGKKETEEESTKEGKFVGGVFIHALLHMKQFQVAHWGKIIFASIQGCKGWNNPGMLFGLGCSVLLRLTRLC